ncbi:hypothetical protein [Pseudomonas fluorescens]|nr:hypothetical protein [Pseudomonas fluorescens]
MEQTQAWITDDCQTFALTMRHSGRHPINGSNGAPGLLDDYCG